MADRPKIAIFASPKCTEDPKLYKAYFNVAWFVRAYSDVLADYTILTTPETQYADANAIVGANATPLPHNDDGYWDVPIGPSLLENGVAESDKFGFDGQVWLMGAIVRGEVERVLMFMDPLDTKEYLPETYAFIRNCTLANVGLHINLGATYWAESVREKKSGQWFGKWSTDEARESDPSFRSLLNAAEQRVHFIAHDSEKEKLSRFVYHYRQALSDRAATGWEFSGTFGTCRDIGKYLAEHAAPYSECPSFHPAGTGTTGHGPSGGDVVIADEIRAKWPVEEPNPDEKKANPAAPVKHKNDVRKKSVSHTVLFFIDYSHPRPHDTDIHVLLRTCLNPHRGVHLILNERSAVEWGETIRAGYFAKGEAGK